MTCSSGAPVLLERKPFPAVYMCRNASICAAHSCAFPGCGGVIVLDGNMKNKRDICYAKNAGFIKFDGLSGSIKTGCPATPGFRSRYCTRHNNHVCTLLSSQDVDEELDMSTGPALRSQLFKYSPGDPASSLLKTLVDQFDAGVRAESGVDTLPLYGHVSSTLTVYEQSSEQRG